MSFLPLLLKVYTIFSPNLFNKSDEAVKEGTIKGI